jgi:hypothetical protein
MLEDHVAEFIRDWGVGIGMGSMSNKVQRLKSMVMEHHRQISPENITRGPPPPTKRQRTDEKS